MQKKIMNLSSSTAKMLSTYLYYVHYLYLSSNHIIQPVSVQLNFMLGKQSSEKHAVGLARKLGQPNSLFALSADLSKNQKACAFICSGIFLTYLQKVSNANEEFITECSDYDWGQPWPFQ